MSRVWDVTEKREIPMFENEAIELLGRKLQPEGFYVVPQVPNSTGAGFKRTADAIMVQTWPSRGLALTGVEYKRSRNDWSRELRNCEKAEPVAAYCHYWLVLAPKGIVPLGQVPPAWGLYEFDDRDRLFRTKPPPLQDHVKDLDLGFLAAVLRAAERVNRNNAVLETDRRELEAKFAERLDARVLERTREHKKLLENVMVFEEASGIKIRRGWSLDTLGESLAIFLKDPDQFRDRLRRDRYQLERMIELTDEILGS
jgi:hypothetical protein